LKTKELCNALAKLQETVDQLRMERAALLRSKKRWEQEKDDFERQKRIDDAVQEDLSERLENALEDKVLLRAELEDIHTGKIGSPSTPLPQSTGPSKETQELEVGHAKKVGVLAILGCIYWTEFFCVLIRARIRLLRSVRGEGDPAL